MPYPTPAVASAGERVKSAPPPVRKKKKGFFYTLNKYKLFYLLILPGLLFFLVFKYIPIYGVTIAFKDVAPFDGVWEMLKAPFIGFTHFKDFMSSYYFPQLLGNTLAISLMRLVFGFPVPIIFALLLNEIRNIHFKKTIQTISYMPHFISMVVLASLMTTLLSTDGGAVNSLIVKLGGEPTYFLGESKYFRPLLVGSGIWKEMGWSTIIYLAAITGIDPQLYEAAIVDGAGRFRRMWSITLPGISGIIVIMLIMSIGTLLDAGFEQVLLLYSAPVYDVADIIDTYVYRKGIIELNYSFSAAVGLFKSVIAMLLIIGSDFLAKKLGQDGLW